LDPALVIVVTAQVSDAARAKRRGRLG